MIGQIQLHSIDYFVVLDCCEWYETDLFDKLVSSIKASKTSVAVANREFEKLRPMKFESIFRQAQKEDVKVGVDEKATFILLRYCLWNKLPTWSWSLLCGVLKHKLGP